MKTTCAWLTVVAVLFTTVAPAVAQQPQALPPGAQPQQPGGMGPARMPGGMMGPGGPLGDHGGMMGGIMGREMMELMRQDPKLAGRLMQMHGEMMKAVGDVMVKYGKMMESGQ